MSPNVTVLMAVYNGSLYLREAIDSILRQTFQDFELLIVNDGSVDDTGAIVRSYADPRIRLVENEHNLGLTRSLNRGLTLAAGALIARHDADDISEPERIARQVTYLRENPAIALLGTSYLKIDQDGRPLGVRWLPCETIDLRWQLLFHCPFVHTAIVFRRSVIDQIGPYDERYVYAQDYELWCRIARTLPVANLAEPLVRMRVNPSSMTATYGEHTKEGFRMAVAQLAGLLRWEGSTGDRNEQRFNAMASLVRGAPQSFAPEQLASAADELMRLHPEFCRYYDIAEAAGARHRRNVVAQITEQLVAAGYWYADRGCARDAWRLLLEAVRLRPSGALSTPLILLFVKLVARPRIVRALRRATRDRLM